MEMKVHWVEQTTVPRATEKGLNNPRAFCDKHSISVSFDRWLFGDCGTFNVMREDWEYQSKIIVQTDVIKLLQRSV